MKKKKDSTIRIQSVSRDSFSVTFDTDLDVSNERTINDAKAICEILIRKVPSITHDEVLAFLKAYKRDGFILSFDQHFDDYFARRLKRLNRIDKKLEPK